MEDILNPKAFIVPKTGTTAKYLMKPEVGTLVFDTDASKLSVCVVSTVGSAAWEAVTSVAE